MFFKFLKFKIKRNIENKTFSKTLTEEKLYTRNYGQVIKTNNIHNSYKTLLNLNESDVNFSFKRQQQQ